jgi:hypothetical protein
MEEVAPGFMMRRITPGLVAERLVAGIERRSPRVVVPRWYSAFAALRGILNPILDSAMARDPRIADLVEQSEREAQTSVSSRPRESA